MSTEAGASMKKRAFIDDGYTLEHCFPPGKFRDEEVEILFRPATSMERVKVNKLVTKLDREGKAEEVENETYKFIALHLVELKCDGESVGFSPERVGRMEPNLLTEMYQVIYGLTPAIAKQREDDAKN